MIVNLGVKKPKWKYLIYIDTDDINLINFALNAIKNW